MKLVFDRDDIKFAVMAIASSILKPTTGQHIEVILGLYTTGAEAYLVRDEEQKAEAEEAK